MGLVVKAVTDRCLDIRQVINAPSFDSLDDGAQVGQRAIRAIELVPGVLDAAKKGDRGAGVKKIKIDSKAGARRLPPVSIPWPKPR